MNKKKNTRAKRKRKSYLPQMLLFLFLIIAITVVVILLLGPSNNDPDESTYSSLSSASEVNSSESMNESTIPTAAQPTQPASFWGDDIDLTVTSEKINASSSYPKWKSGPGFAVPEHDLSIFKTNAQSDKPLQGAVIFLDPGHGGEDLGAVYPRSPIKPEIIESQINLNVAFTLKELLEEAGATVVMTREEDYFYRLYYRSAIVGKYILTDFLSKLSAQSTNRTIIEGYIDEMDATIERNDHDDPADIFYPKGVNQTIKNILDIESSYSGAIFLSIHCNAAAEPNTLKGAKVYYVSNSSVYNLQSSVSKDIVEPEYQNFNDTERERLASLIYSEITSAIPAMEYTYSGEAVQATDYSVIRETNLVSALIEMGYVNSTADKEILLDPDYQDKYADAIYEAVYNYYCG